MVLWLLNININMKIRNNIIFTIGIDTYQSDMWTNLNNAVFDCKSIIKVLVEKYSFEEYPNSLFDNTATKENIYNELRTLQNSILPDDNLIIFFAGHGNMNPNTSRGYLVPYEGKADSATWIENTVIKDFIEDIKSQHTWLILDSCFSGSFLTKNRGYGIDKLYEDLDNKQSRWVTTSGREEKVSDGTKGDHSPFCKTLIYFLENNESKYSSVSEIVHFVSKITAHTSRQVPQGAFIDNIGHEGGELILKLKDKFVKESKITTIGISSSEKIKQKLAKYEGHKSKISSGKEIIIVKSIHNKDHIIIFENLRFNKNGIKKHRFKNLNVIFGSIVEFEIIQRFATISGLERYLIINYEKFNKFKKKSFFQENIDVELAENSLYAIAHANYLQSLLDANPDRMECLHCGGKISTNDGYLVEIDENGLVENIGTVHNECLRPSDRIIGQSGYEGLSDSHLINFDYNLWIDLIKKGQGQIRPIYSNSQLPKVCILSWNEGYGVNEGKYCIREYFDNGDIKYVQRGKDIERFSDIEIDEYLNLFRDSLLKKEGKEYNPIAMIIETKQFGPLQYLKGIKTDAQTIAIAVKYEKCIYSQQFEEVVSNKIENDYTPVVILKDIDSGQVFGMGNIIPFISKVENIDEYINNWKNIIGDFNKCSLEIIKSDPELNELLIEIYKNELRPILNPIFDENFNLISGIEFIERDTLLNVRKDKKDVWKQGDIVKLVFPGMESNDKFPVGKILTDIFEEEGDSFIIFQPIENGKLLDGMQYKIPTSIIKKL